MRRADRLFRLVQLLRSRRLVTAQWLAGELDVSKRTIYRDIRDLEYSGVPIQGEAGVGYQLQRGYELPPLTFNAAEIEALVLGARIVATHGDAEIAQAAKSAMEKVEAVLPPALRAVLTNTALFAPSFGRGQAPDALGDIRRAIGRRNKIRFAYTRGDGAESSRTVRPLALYYWRTSWSLAAWCELREAYRNFRPDRMQEFTVLKQTFSDEEGVSLEAFHDQMREQARQRGYDSPL